MGEIYRQRIWKLLKLAEGDRERDEKVDERDGDDESRHGSRIRNHG